MNSVNPPTGSPKLQSIKYVNILPSGKLGQYKENEQIDFKIDAVQNTSTWANGAGGAVPMCFPANMGANALINRLTLSTGDGTGKIVEDLEAYNAYNGILNAYRHDADVFPSLAKVEGVSGRTNSCINQTIDNLGVGYFCPNGSVAANVITGGTTGIEASFALPVQSGLFSAFNQSSAVPNMDIGGLHLRYHLERADRIMNVLCHKFYQKVTINTVANCEVIKAVNPISEVVGCSTNATDGLTFLVQNAYCDPSISVNGVPYSVDMCAFRVGMPISCVDTTTPLAAVIVGITKVELTATHIQVTVDTALTVSANYEVKWSAINRSYNIENVELRILNTLPDPQTMKQIRRSMARGINFNSHTLYKLSTAAQLKNAVLDIPESLTRALSMMVVPVQQSGLELADQKNSYVWTRPDSIYSQVDGVTPGDLNDYSYQWQVSQSLIPNLQVETNHLVDNKNDNVIYFNQQKMSLRPMIKIRSLGDNMDHSAPWDLDLPYFFPILLAPQGSSFSLIDTAPQLRVENSQSGASITSKLYHSFVNHVRLLKADDRGVTIEF